MKYVNKFSHLFGIALLASTLTACSNNEAESSAASLASAPWVSDLGNGLYKNPVLHADYSDPDVIRVGDTYYMTSSSFNAAPGLPLLESKDMVNWEIVGHVFAQQHPLDVHVSPQHGGGVWAPSLRHHDGKFYIYYGDPDVGIYMYQAENFRGPWSKPHLVIQAKGLIDPVPFWDEDGQAYLVHAWAASRVGISNKLTLRKLSPDGKTVLDTEGPVIIDGDLLEGYRALEGPKMHKRNGYYYIFAPAGGVAPGWQSVFRSKNIHGPYEDKIVLEQGNSPINGPHQGSWVDTPEGTHWFYHFQDKGVYGRIVHLQPMRWENDWPLIGQNIDANGKGEPVLIHEKPVAGFPIKIPATSDEFSEKTLGLQWQWNSNWLADWYSLTANKGHMRLFTQYTEKAETAKNMWYTPNILTQKIPAPEFKVDTKIRLSAKEEGDRAGIIIYGFHYAWLGLRQHEGKTELVYTTNHDAQSERAERIRLTQVIESNEVYLRVIMQSPGKTEFFYSLDGENYRQFGGLFTADRGRWVGGQLGLFSISSKASKGFADVDYFRVTSLE